MDYGVVLIPLVILLFYLPVLSALFDTWLVNPFYTHGSLVFLVSIFLVYRQRKSLKKSDNDFLFGSVFLALGLAVYGLGFMYKSLTLSGLSMIIVLSGYVIAFYGKDSFKRIWFPIFFLIFAIPMPYTDDVVIGMQSVTASSSASLLRFIGVPAVNVGSQISIPSVLFEIGEPCSGMRTLLALLALSALYAYLCNNAPWKKVLLFVLAFPLALVANILRVALIVALAHWFGEDIAMRFFHDFSSAFVLLLSMAFIFIAARCLGCKGIRNI